MTFVVNGYVEPTTYEEAEARRQALAVDFNDIQAQLSARGSEHMSKRAAGHPHDPAFWHWRRGAVYALNAKRAELTLVRAWMKNYNRAQQQARAQASKARFADPNAAAGAAVRRLMSDAFRQVCDYTRGLEARIRALEASAVVAEQ